jgi:hypothetical protein
MAPYSLIDIYSSYGGMCSLHIQDDYQGNRFVFRTTDVSVFEPFSKFGGRTEIDHILKNTFGPRRDRITREWRKLPNAEIWGIYSSPTKILVTVGPQNIT